MNEQGEYSKSNLTWEEYKEQGERRSAELEQLSKEQLLEQIKNEMGDYDITFTQLFNGTELNPDTRTGLQKISTMIYALDKKLNPEKYQNREKNLEE